MAKTQLKAGTKSKPEALLGEVPVVISDSEAEKRVSAFLQTPVILPVKVSVLEPHHRCIAAMLMAGKSYRAISRFLTDPAVGLGVTGGGTSPGSVIDFVRKRISGRITERKEQQSLADYKLAGLALERYYEGKEPSEILARHPKVPEGTMAEHVLVQLAPAVKRDDQSTITAATPIAITHASQVTSPGNILVAAEKQKTSTSPLKSEKANKPGKVTVRLRTYDDLKKETLELTESLEGFV